MFRYEIWQHDQRIADIDNEGESIEIRALADGLELASGTAFVHDAEEFYDEVELFEELALAQFGVDTSSVDPYGFSVQAYINDMLSYEKTWL